MTEPAPLELSPEVMVPMNHAVAELTPSVPRMVSAPLLTPGAKPMKDNERRSATMIVPTLSVLAAPSSRPAAPPLAEFCHPSRIVLAVITLFCASVMVPVARPPTVLEPTPI